MSRRSMLAFAFVAINLMACCCGGVPQAPRPVAGYAAKINLALAAEVARKIG